MSNVNACLDFLQRLIQTPSLPGQEGTIARIVADECKTLGYDDVSVDDAGNVIARINGRGEAPSVMFNTHLDHVDAGDAQAWPHPPFDGVISEGKVWGRGASDIKGPLAAQVHGVADLITDAEPPPGDVFVTAVVQEECGGLGARHLVTYMEPDLVVVGEPSSNELRRGHRGRTEAILHVRGASAHASAPGRGVNPLDVIANFITNMRSLEMREHAGLGHSTVVPTLLQTDQESANVIPGEAWLTCDWRNVPGETSEDVRAALQDLAEASCIEGATVEILIPTHEFVSYSGLRMNMGANNPPYALPADHPILIAAQTVLTTPLGAPPPIGTWDFATDGGHFAKAGLTVVGFGPGNESVVHTSHEYIESSEIEAALTAYAALAREWPAATVKRT